MLPGYIFAHVGSLVTRSDVLRLNPLREIFLALLGAIRTSTFQGVYVMIYIGAFFSVPFMTDRVLTLPTVCRRSVMVRQRQPLQTHREA